MRITQQNTGRLYSFSFGSLDHRFSFSNPAFVDELAEFCVLHSAMVYEYTPQEVTLLIYRSYRSNRRRISKFITNYFTKKH